jgi:hypothetical protein
MTLVKLPAVLRPRNVYYKKCALGIDLPSWFVNELQGIDSKLYPIYHKYSTLYEHTVANDYEGELADPRYAINSKYGHLNMGFLPTDGQGAPQLEGRWHVWRLCDPHGWSHVFCCQSNSDVLYLQRFLRLLYLQGQYNEKYRGKGYSMMLDALDAKERHAKMDEKREAFMALQDANQALVNRVKQNYLSGLYNKPLPKKDIIFSGMGLSKRSKITRDLEDTDKESGIILKV